jgi:flagellar biogenesis protein FliO
MRTQRASALSMSHGARAAAVLAPQILPAISSTKPDSSAGPTAGSKRSTKRKALQKKQTVQRNRSMPKQKIAKKHTARLMSAARTENTKKMPPSTAKNSLPQLVPSEKTSLVKNEPEMTLTVNAAFINPVSPMLAVVEDEQIEPARLEGNEIVTDRHHADEPSQPTEVGDLASDTMTPELCTALTEQKSTFLQALALQCTGLFRILTRAWNWTQQKLKSHQVRKRLRVCETVSLGDKRFIAVIQVDGEQFLVGGSSSSVSTLAHLEPRRDFSEVFRSRCEQDLSQA